jgi:HD-GYP domain-containing protein (c-di-GMP phosphodiesterase class II)
MMLVDNHSPTESRSRSPADQAGALRVVLKEEFGVDFRFYDAATGAPVEELPAKQNGEASWRPPVLDRAAVLELAAEGRARVLARADGRYQLALLLYQGSRPAFVGTAVLAALARSEADAGREKTMLRNWLQAVSDRLRLTDQLAVRHRREEDWSAQSTVPWEALLNLDQVMRRLRIHKQADKSPQRILEAAFSLLGVETLAWIPHNPDHPVVFQGKTCPAPADCRQLAAMLAKNSDFRPPGPLWCEQVQAQPWGACFPTVGNLMAFQATDQGNLGWLVAINKTARGGKVSEGKDHSPLTAHYSPFRKSDAALLMPFAALMELYARSTHRYQDLKDLLVGLTRSLTMALDAKDSYTFGHSERVARIAVELGREMGLEGDELGDIYLAGLLHDVGKIGIRDTVLKKPDALTTEEQEHIKQHVTIGYSILADLRQIRNLLPGVLYHHERYDGAGYPDGLVGENIPLLARILAVADAYDAMSNARPYRGAMPCRKVEEILTKGMGTQWDKQVVEAFLRCRHKVHTIRQRGVGDSLRLAIEGTLRSEVHSLRTELRQPETVAAPRF